jgi:hypothetical protein
MKWTSDSFGNLLNCFSAAILCDCQSLCSLSHVNNRSMRENGFLDISNFVKLLNCFLYWG